MKLKFLIIMSLYMTLNACTSIPPLKQTDKLNLSNIAVTSIYSNVKLVKGAFCTKNKLTTIVDNGSLPPVSLHILKESNKSSTEHYEAIHGGILLYEAKNESLIVNKQEMQSFAKDKSNCGANNEYPYIYSFDLSFNTPDSTTNEFFKEREAILNQIKQKHYVDIVAVQPPYMRIDKPILISSQPARLFFSNEQLTKLEL